jgi:hypothetical protein
VPGVETAEDGCGAGELFPGAGAFAGFALGGFDFGGDFGVRGDGALTGVAAGLETEAIGVDTGPPVAGDDPGLDKDGLRRPDMGGACSGAAWEGFGGSCGVWSAGDAFGGCAAEAVGAPGPGGKTNRTALFMDSMMWSEQR